MVSAIVAVGRDGGHPVEAVRLLSGAVWLSSTHVGQLTLLDGSAEQVAAQVQVASYRDTINAVRDRTIGYAVNRTAGWIRRVDGATFELSPQASTIPRGGDGLRAFTGPETLYTLNIRRGALTQADPATLASWSGGLQPPAGQIGS